MSPRCDFNFEIYANSSLRNCLSQQEKQVKIKKTFMELYKYHLKVFEEK